MALSLISFTEAYPYGAITQKVVATTKGSTPKKSIGYINTYYLVSSESELKNNFTL